MQGNIYVTGGGSNADLSLVNKRFLADIPLGGRILYIPYAMKNESRLNTCVETFYNMLQTQNRTDIVFDVSKIETFLHISILYQKKKRNPVPRVKQKGCSVR